MDAHVTSLPDTVSIKCWNCEKKKSVPISLYRNKETCDSFTVKCDGCNKLIGPGKRSKYYDLSDIDSDRSVWRWRGEGSKCGPGPNCYGYMY